jgi:hypothetical protein
MSLSQPCVNIFLCFPYKESLLHIFFSCLFVSLLSSDPLLRTHHVTRLAIESQALQENVSYIPTPDTSLMDCFLSYLKILIWC